MSSLFPHNGTFVSDYPSLLGVKYFVGGPYISPKLNYFSFLLMNFAMSLHQLL
jgi:hypothetical protein